MLVVVAGFHFLFFLKSVFIMSVILSVHIFLPVMCNLSVGKLTPQCQSKDTCQVSLSRIL